MGRKHWFSVKYHKHFSVCLCFQLNNKCIGTTKYLQTKIYRTIIEEGFSKHWFSKGSLKSNWARELSQNTTTAICCYSNRGDQIFFSATCPGQVASKNPLVLMNFLLVPKYFSNYISLGQVANTTISYSKCNSNQTVVDEGSSDL